ncbi:MAG: RsmB/NOP family class I SAM-dependent RNA methyltransferase [Paracoccus sp. (in: a-proteobacteria)]|nr:RsmB/NOP family class I SAM-dependent RNA methyltransferase [Paracoccus sp. (in: a-proteobacteria)]
MTPAARVGAAIGILDAILAGQPAEPALLAWARASRFAGSGDRAAVRDLVFEALRRRDSLAALGGGLGGRGLMLGLARLRGDDPAAIFSGQGHAPAPLAPGEGEGAASPSDADALSDLPGWIWPEWQRSLGGGALAAAHLMRGRAPVWLRVNPRLATPARAAAALAGDGIGTDPHPALPSALRVSEGERRIAASRAYLDGMVELQDLSPQMACALLPLRKGDRVLDYCAGGGGKSLALAARADIALTAHDAAPARMSDLPARARRARVPITVSPPQRLARAYDLVVVDVPCSGSGTWRRTPDAKWRLTPDGLDALRDTQAAILRDVAGLVVPGGHLAYMTCSVLAQENEDRIDDFLNDNNAFRKVSDRRWLQPDGSDGFYLSLLRREGAD